MSSRSDSEEPEWRLPWWLKFLDKTNITVVTLTAGFLLYTQSAGVAYFVAGAVSCMSAVKLIKKLIRQERPEVKWPGKRRKKTYGMPSTHSGSVAYYATYITLASLYLPVHDTLPQSWLTRILPPLVILPMAGLIAVSRVWLGHHTWAQVSVGCSFGLVFGCSWFYLWTHGLNELGIAVEQLWKSHLDCYYRR
ncbi:hypothetical protein GYMLUDRAFT_261882 [Collybiopsis luxurians FD-317 M1]|uniref:Phosphatidic acid phosphatase type 2/haloperoxidase domain-containing protein n=1 Tax=Collybiopsis luxurians FD-317 M1 TaxID=944289 RepID=A0A0D0CBP1_9AGAR|nr:hypothetical protein GYMLUDRAFT_261882 [Collybiopsis luxurians FD-317 M1]